MGFDIRFSGFPPALTAQMVARDGTPTQAERWQVKNLSAHLSPAIFLPAFRFRQGQVRISSFGFPSDFGIRFSGFPPALTAQMVARVGTPMQAKRLEVKNLSPHLSPAIFLPAFRFRQGQVRISSFGFPSDFDIRISDLPAALTAQMVARDGTPTQAERWQVKNLSAHLSPAIFLPAFPLWQGELRISDFGLPPGLTCIKAPQPRPS